MENAIEVINEISSNLTQHSSSKKDEIIVMKAILNDPDYSVDVYSNNGDITKYCPSIDTRKVISNIVSNVTQMPIKEARALVESYEFTKSDSLALVNLSKEFVNSYLQTGRKLPLGGRETSDIELMWKNIEERKVEVPSSSETKERIEVIIPAHGGIKASCPCPAWIKE